jgi:HK97 family phage major capsid protein
MTTTREIRSRLETARNEMRAILAAPAGADGDLSPEQAARFDAIRGEADRLAQNEARVAALEEVDRRSAGQPVGSTGDGRLDDAMTGYSLGRAIAFTAGLPGVDAGRERELGAEIARRSGLSFKGLAVPFSVFQTPVERRAVTSAGTGGNLIGTTLEGQTIDRLRPALTIMRLGSTVVDGLTGNIAFSKLVTSPSTAWIADGGTITPSDPTFGQVTMNPKHCAVITEYSRAMLLQSSPAVEQVLRDDFTKQMAANLDFAAIAGTGASNQPRGVLNTVGIGSVAMGANGGALSYDAVQDLAGAVVDQNGDGASAAFLSNTKVRRALAKLKDSQNRPLGLDTILGGRPAAWSNLVPSNLTKGTGTNLSAALFGNWSELLLGIWSAVDLLSNPYGDAYQRGGVQVRAVMSVDIAVRHPESFAAIQDAIA